LIASLWTTRDGFPWTAARSSRLSMDYVKMSGFVLFVSQCNIAARPRTFVAFL
jgi:hypothetical protein